MMNPVKVQTSDNAPDEIDREIAEVFLSGLGQLSDDRFSETIQILVFIAQKKGK